MSFLDSNLQPNRSNLGKWFLLKLLSIVYGCLIKFWLILYQSGVKTAYSPLKPTISIGNITVGGTGKTPMVDWFLKFLKEKKLSTCVLTRGYKAVGQPGIRVLDRSTAYQGNSRLFGDEPWLLFKKHPETTFYIYPDRAISARQAELKMDVLLLDDGMQHLRINRGINIILIDSLAGIGNGKILPLGPLREPLSGLSRADVVIYTRTNLASPQELKKVITAHLQPDTPQFNASFIPEKIMSSINFK